MRPTPVRPPEQEQVLPVPVTAYGAARLLAGTHGRIRLDLAEHRRVHGDQRVLDRDRLAAAAADVALLGHGGAAFPVAIKLRSTPVGRATEVLVNGSEGEPASYKDRVLMRLAPHLVIDGALAVAGALGTHRVTIVVHDKLARASLTGALLERGSGAASVRVVAATGRFVGGEVRAAMRSVGGGPAVPPGRRILPHVSGVEGRPTFASNVETFAQLAILCSLGTRDYASVGHPDEPGTTLVTVWGDVAFPGVAEVPTGMALPALLGPGEGPVLVGGYHGTWVDSADGLVIARPALRAAGAPLNAGVLARLPADACALAEVAAVAGWLASESAGQCGPCVFGLPAIARDIGGLLRGQDLADAARRRAELVVGRGACAHPDGSSAFVRSALLVHAAEVVAHRAHGNCGHPYRGVLPLPAGLRDGGAR